MGIQYDKPTIQALMEALSGFQRSFSRTADDLSGDMAQCRSHYTRLHSQLTSLAEQARRRLESARQDIRAAQAEYDTAMDAAANAEEESERSAAERRARQAMAEMAEAQRQEAAAEAALQRQQGKLARLTAAWNTHGADAEQNLAAISEHQQNATLLVQSANRDLEQFSQMMEQAKAELYSETGTAAAGATAGISVSAGSGRGAGSPVSRGASTGSRASMPGWCPKNSMQAVSAAPDGSKQLSLSIGGSTRQFSCDKNGLARAYEAATAAGDADMAARISAMFEIETLREDLELGTGDPAYVQLGGYHRDVQNQDPQGYESHHIPARSVQDESAGWLPTIAITQADHSDTFSYRGKQNHAYASPFAPSEPGVRYRDMVSGKISQGGSGYIEALRCEVWDLRNSTAHRYDGGISAYLDAVIDLLATRGIPGNK